MYEEINILRRNSYIYFIFSIYIKVIDVCPIYSVKILFNPGGLIMRITAQSNVDLSIQQNAKAKTVETAQDNEKSYVENVTLQKNVSESSSLNSTTQEAKFAREELEQAVDTMNELLENTHKASKFILHDGLNKYYVRLVDTETEEVIKEIPPERLLDAFYEMQKLAGMIVDEKV